MKSIIAACGLVFAQSFSATCSTFNLNYEFCYESWLSPKMATQIQGLLNESDIQGNLNFRKEEHKDSLRFIIEVKDSKLVNDLANAPKEIRNQGFSEAMGTTYGTYLATLAAAYIGPRQESGELSRDSIKKLVPQMQFSFNLLNDKGTLAKSYDLTKYALYVLVKTGRKSRGEEDE